MISHKDTLADWAITCEALALEYWESHSDQDPSEYAHECADGCQWAIYYSHAWCLVNAARLLRPSDLDQAESDLEGLGFEVAGLQFESFDKTMSLIAYRLTYTEILTQIQKQESDND